MSFLLTNRKLATVFVSQMTRGTAARAKSSEKTLTRSGIAKLVAKEHELTVANAEKIVKTVFDRIVEVRHVSMNNMMMFGCVLYKIDFCLTCSVPP